MAPQPPLGARLERARIDSGLSLLEARHAIPVSETVIVESWEHGTKIPSEAHIARVVEVYTSTDHYRDNARPYPGRAEAERRGLTLVPPDVLEGELLELRERAIALRKKERARKLATGLGGVIAALAFFGPTTANATARPCHGTCLIPARQPRTNLAVRTANRTHRRGRRRL